MDWVIHIHALLRLREETLFLSINYIDRFLCVLHDVDWRWLQLLGAVAIWTASKYEEGRKTLSTYTILYAAGHISKEVALSSAGTI